MSACFTGYAQQFSAITDWYRYILCILKSSLSETSPVIPVRKQRLQLFISFSDLLCHLHVLELDNSFPVDEFLTLYCKHFSCRLGWKNLEMFYLLSKFGFVDNYGKEVLNDHFLSKLLLCKVRSSWFQDILLSALRDGSFKGRWHWMLCTQLAVLGPPTCSSSVEVLC